MPRGNPNFGKKKEPVGDTVTSTEPVVGTAQVQAPTLPLPETAQLMSVHPTLPLPTSTPQAQAEYVPKGIVNIVTFPDQKCLMGTQSIIQDALVYFGFDENGDKIEKKKDFLFAVQDISKDGVWQLRIDSEKGVVTQEFMNPIIAKQFAQGQGFLLGKQEQQRREFDKMGI